MAICLFNPSTVCRTTLVNRARMENGTAVALYLTKEEDSLPKQLSVWKPTSGVTSLPRGASQRHLFFHASVVCHWWISQSPDQLYASSTGRAEPRYGWCPSPVNLPTMAGFQSQLWTGTPISCHRWKGAVFWWHTKISSNILVEKEALIENTTSCDKREPAWRSG